MRGRLDAEGDLLASLVVIGDVIKVKGKIARAVVGDTFVLTPDPGQSITGSALTVALSTETGIYSGCDTIVDRTFIQVGMGARVVGKLDADSGEFKAVAVFLTPRKISGTIAGISEGSLTLNPPGITVAVPQGVVPYLLGHGQVPQAYLVERINCLTTPGIEAQVYLDPEFSTPTALDILIPPESFNADDSASTVNIIYPLQRIIEVQDGRQIYVQEGATILWRNGDADTPISLEALAQVNNVQIRAYGLQTCAGANTVDFYGFILIAATTLP